MPKPAPNFNEVARACREFTIEFLGKTPMGLPKDLSEADFGLCMDSLVRAIKAAYFEGHAHGLKRIP